jgi:hypothetical protein
LTGILGGSLMSLARSTGRGLEDVADAEARTVLARRCCGRSDAQRRPSRHGSEAGSDRHGGVKVLSNDAVTVPAQMISDQAYASP